MQVSGAAAASLWFVTSGIETVCGGGGTAVVKPAVVEAAVVVAVVAAGLVVAAAPAPPAVVELAGKVVEGVAAATRRVTLDPFVSFTPGFGACSTIVPAGLPEDTGVAAALSPSAARVARRSRKRPPEIRDRSLRCAC